MRNRRACRLTCGLLLLGLLPAPSASAQPETRSASPSIAIAQKVRPLFDGERALKTVAFLDQYVRWPGNRGFEASIDHVAAQLEAAGYVREDHAPPGAMLTYRVEHYPMDAPAWEPLDATVEVVGQAEPVLQWNTNRNMLAVNSFATPPGGVTATLVDAGSGSEEELDAAGVEGKVVLADRNVGRLFRDAVVRRGAVGVLGYSMPAYTQPEKNRTSIQFGRVQRDTTAQAWGLSLSYEARERLHAALAKGPVQLHVTTDVRWTPGAVERTVVADIHGRTHPDERFVFSAHVQEPGANDNASGVGAEVEMARVAAALVQNGDVVPDRTITFLWGLEITSTDRYIRQDSVRAAGIRWGLSLDMVGENTAKTGGTFLIEKMPDPSAIWTRGQDHHTEWGGRPLTKDDMTPHYFNDFVLGRALEQAATDGWVVKTNPFEGGSDHTPFLRAGKPGVLFWHFTDQFYHTDRDRLEMVSAEEVRNVGIAALVSGLTLATADGATARAMVAETLAAAKARLQDETALSRKALAGGGDVAAQRDILNTWAAWYEGALEALDDVEVGGTSATTQAAIDGAILALHDTLAASLKQLDAG